MKKICPIIILLFITTFLTAREVHNINRNWKFFSDREISADRAFTVNLPHTWNNDALGGKRDYFRGVGNYLKEMDIPASWSGKRVFIKCYGANSMANVFINSRLVGEHRGGYTAFCYEITDFVRYGRKNFIWIMVNNSPQTDILPTAGDANVYGGVFRDVELIVTGREIVSLTENGSDGIYIKQNKVDKESVQGEAIIKVNGVKDGNVNVKMRIYNSLMDSTVVKTTRARLNGRMTTTVTIPFEIERPRLWNGEKDPFCYQFAISVEADGKFTDEKEITTGFRTVSFDDKGQFVLNGEIYPVRGVYVTQDRAMAGNAITDYQVAEDVAIIREIGANAVRISGVCHHPLFYELCMEQGILILNDFPLVGPAYMTERGFFNTESFRNNGIAQSEDIMLQLYNNPAVVMWGIFSELSSRGDSPADYISLLNMKAKREGGNRLTYAASNTDGEINFITDAVIWNQALGWKDGVPEDIRTWNNQLKTNWKNLKSAVSNTVGGSVLHQSDSLRKPRYMGNWHPERWQTHVHEVYVSSIFPGEGFWGVMTGNIFDYGAAGRLSGEANGLNSTGLVTFDRKYKKDAFYLYKANWNKTEPFVYITERRWANRQSPTQTVTVYSNSDNVELILNGESKGVRKGENGVFRWTNLKFEKGRNSIDAITKESRDGIYINIVRDN